MYGVNHMGSWGFFYGVMVHGVMGSSSFDAILYIWPRVEVWKAGWHLLHLLVVPGTVKVFTGRADH